MLANIEDLDRIITQAESKLTRQQHAVDSTRALIELLKAERDKRASKTTK